MKKSIADARAATCEFNQESLKELRKKGYKYVQVKALTSDNHYDYVEPNIIVLAPIKELSGTSGNGEVYASLDTTILEEWAKEINDELKIFVAAG